MTDELIEIKDLNKSFAAVEAVREVSFSAGQGEILGILGPNGAGKTTTLRILCGYLAPDSGVARVAGHDVATESVAARRKIGYLPESTPLYPEMRVVEYLGYRAGLKGVARRERMESLTDAARRCGIEDVLRRTIGTLSKGYRQRVGLADALVARPPVLVLDEPTVGLDPNQVLELRGSHTILLSSHILSEIEQVCDRVVIFRQGNVIAVDSTERLRSRSSLGATVTVEMRAAVTPAEELVRGVAQIERIEQLEDGWTRLTLLAEQDPREPLFTRAVEHGVTLRELTRRQLSLEEIFHELTAGDRQDDLEGAPRPGDGGPPDTKRTGERPGDGAFDGEVRR